MKQMHQFVHLYRESNSFAILSMTMTEAANSPGSVAVFISALIIRLAQTDPALRPFVDGLRLTGTTGSGYGPQWHHSLSDTFGQNVIDQLPIRVSTSREWSSQFWVKARRNQLMS